MLTITKSAMAIVKGVLLIIENVSMFTRSKVKTQSSKLQRKTQNDRQNFEL